MTRGSMAIAAFSTEIEWFDSTLYLHLPSVLSPETAPIRSKTD